MKIKDIIQETPEISEEKLIEIIDSHLKMMSSYAKKRIKELHKGEYNLAKVFLDEYDLIQDKKSYLTKSQREQIVGFVGMCMIKMVKRNAEEKSEETN